MRNQYVHSAVKKHSMSGLGKWFIRAGKWVPGQKAAKVV